MNEIWQNSRLTHLAVLSISGDDAATLLQGQITCNINDISDTHSSLGAICNAKGRAITTFLLLKQADVFHLIVPNELLEPVKKRLTMFVLRAKVVITDNSAHLGLLGITPSQMPTVDWFATSQQPQLRVQFGNRDLVLVNRAEAAALCQTANITLLTSHDWLLSDINAGIPWLTPATSEAFVPQMLNLDKLGGISFTKGCYTGQEIIARTHYLGKSKRGMLLAETTLPVAPEPNSAVINAQGDTVGQVLIGYDGRLLIVVQLSETNDYPLCLADHTPLTVFSTLENGLCLP